MVMITPPAFDYGGKLIEDNGGQRQYRSGILIMGTTELNDQAVEWSR